MIVTDIKELVKPCLPVSSVREGVEITRKLFGFLEKNNKMAIKQKGSGRVSLGCGLAANQIGIPKQVCVILSGETRLALMNPRIVEVSEAMVDWKEGCLSFPGQTVQTRRHVWIQVETLNVGTIVIGPQVNTLHTDILKSVIAQHEISHLAGLTFHAFEVGKQVKCPTMWFET